MRNGRKNPQSRIQVAVLERVEHLLESFYQKGNEKRK